MPMFWKFAQLQTLIVFQRRGFTIAFGFDNLRKVNIPMQRFVYDSCVHPRLPSQIQA